jgi:hypothetical protein
MKSLILHKIGVIEKVQVNNIMCSDMGDSIIITENDIRQLNASAVFGAKLISSNSVGKIENLSGEPNDDPQKE